MFARSYFAPRYFPSGYFLAGHEPAGWFAHNWFASGYYAPRYYAPSGTGGAGGSAGGYFAHNWFSQRWYSSWYYCPATERSSLIGLSIIEKPHVSLIPSRYVDWWVLCKPAVSWTATNFHRVRFEVIESPFVEFVPSVVALHGEFNIIEKPFVGFVTTIGKSQECISADGSAGSAPVINAVY